MVCSGVVNWVLYDYLVWLVFICSFLGVFLDFLCFYRSFGYASTLSLDLVALGFVFAGRFGSLILSFVRTSFLTPLIGGGIVDLFTLKIGLLVVSWGLLLLVYIVLLVSLLFLLLLGLGLRFSMGLKAS